jgi:hypothetical protein
MLLEVKKTKSPSVGSTRLNLKIFVPSSSLEGIYKEVLDISEWTKARFFCYGLEIKKILAMSKIKRKKKWQKCL